ncbi:hypothetical protein GWK47_006348 [Chionoecetes opilio]|uniref:Uncharacterized protein n=1 Tax=Chionoecetes opilio TaxID=41210 RepID=A0A8J4Y689_CHIOP|nr:hypothetical protein GWK47_006348 [Chionoecetes opilio]
MDDWLDSPLRKKRRNAAGSSRNKKQLHLRQDYVNMVMKRQSTNKVLEKHEQVFGIRVLPTSHHPEGNRHPDAGERVCAKRLLVGTREPPSIRLCEATGGRRGSPLEKDGLKGLDWDDSSDEEDDDNLIGIGLESNSYNDEEAMLREEEQERKAAEGEGGHCVAPKPKQDFRELHAQYSTVKDCKPNRTRCRNVPHLPALRIQALGSSVTPRHLGQIRQASHQQRQIPRLQRLKYRLSRGNTSALALPKPGCFQDN